MWMKRHGNSPALSPLCDCTCIKSAVGLRQQQASVYKLGFFTCMHMKHRPLPSSGGNKVFLFFWNLICCRWGRFVLLWLFHSHCWCFTNVSLFEYWKSTVVFVSYLDVLSFCMTEKSTFYLDNLPYWYTNQRMLPTVEFYICHCGQTEKTNILAFFSLKEYK